MKRDFPKESFEHTSYEVITQNTAFTLAMAQATQIIEQQKPVFKHETKDLTAFFLKGYPESPYDYVTFKNSNKTSILAFNADNQKEYDKILSNLGHGYDKPIYFDTICIGSFYNKDIKGHKAFEVLMESNFMKASQLLINNEPLVVNKGEVSSMNIHLDSIAEFVKTLQYHQLFPEGDIDSEMKRIGLQVAEKNSADDFLPYFTDTLSGLNTLKISSKKPVVYNDCDSKLFPGEVEHSFVVKNNGRSGYVVHYHGESNTWNVYQIFPVSEFQHEKDIFKIIKENNGQPDLMNMVMQIQDDKLVWVNGSLADLHIDMFCADREINDLIEEQQAKKSMKP
jgi:hypothetical protein